MRNISKYITRIILVVINIIPVYAFAQVNITVQVLPPYYLQIADYASHPSQVLVTATNLTASPLNLQLRGTITGDNGITITTNPNYKGPAPIVLNANSTRILTGRDIPAFFDSNLFGHGSVVLSGYTVDDFVNKGGFPEGNYRFCVQAFDYDSGAPLSVGQPVGCSNSINTISVEPPTIISPYNRQEISSIANNIIVMSWSTPASAPPSVRYRLRMVEMRGTSDDPNVAFATSRIFFDKDNIMSNTYVYNPSDPQLNPGKKYAIMVQAIDPTSTMSFKNQGRSVIYSFAYVASQVVYDAPVITSPDNKEQIHAINNKPVKFSINWTKPMGVTDQVKAKLTIIQVPDDKSAEEVMANLKPPVFLNFEAFNTYSYDYDISKGSPVMVPGKKYAVMVQLIDPQNTAKFRNDGKSGVISFVYTKNTQQ